MYQMVLPDMRVWFPCSVGVPVFPCPLKDAPWWFPHVDTGCINFRMVYWSGSGSFRDTLLTDALVDHTPSGTVWYFFYPLLACGTFLPITWDSPPHVGKAEQVLYLSPWSFKYITAISLTTMKSTVVIYVVIRYHTREVWQDIRRLYMMESDTVTGIAIIKQLQWEI